MLVFFYLSKILGLFLDPVNLLVLAVIVAFWLLWRGRVRGAKWVLGLAAACLLLVLLAPLSEAMLSPLEQRFPRLQPLPDKVDGIILLGGAQRPVMTKVHGQASLNAAAETLTNFLALARRYPQAKLVFSGGGGDPLQQDVSEVHTVRLFLREQGFDPARVIYEPRSRNTYENAVLSYALVRPQPRERWIMIASAASTPRAMGVFRKAGWTVMPFPCDFNSAHWSTFHPTINIRDRLTSVNLATHEWVGLAMYYWTGKSSELFPAP